MIIVIVKRHRTIFLLNRATSTVIPSICYEEFVTWLTMLRLARPQVVRKPKGQFHSHLPLLNKAALLNLVPILRNLAQLSTNIGVYSPVNRFAFKVISNINIFYSAKWYGTCKSLKFYRRSSSSSKQSVFLYIFFEISENAAIWR